jgi:spermidine synthase
MPGVGTVYEELDHHTTPLGDLVLRKRRLPDHPEPVFEITLGGAFLMSSLVCESEVALADLALDALGRDRASVLVGGLGLGYTAKAALDHPGSSDVTVVEMLPEVIAWHRRGLLPLGTVLVESSRCRLVLDDFYAAVSGPREGGRTWDVVLVDIDHSPEALLHTAHAAFYTTEGLARTRRNLSDGGVLAVWAGFAADPAFVERLGDVFEEAWAEEVCFHNPSVARDDVNTVYLARG